MWRPSGRLLLTLLISCGCVVGAGCDIRRLRWPTLPLRTTSSPSAIFWAESFDALNTQHWREASIHGYTAYAAVELEGRRCLAARSHHAASILLSGVRFNPEIYPWLSWEWRVDQLVAGEALERKDGSDAAARVYVYFETKGLGWKKRNLDYVWSASVPVGTIMSSAYSTDSKIIIAESGSGALGQWRAVQRNIAQDYRNAFGGDAPSVIVIGVMTDTDNTKGEALAYFDELRVSRSIEPLPAR